MDADLALLTRCVGDVDRFAAEHWGRRSLLRPSGTGFTDLLNLEDVEHLLLATARRPAFRLVQDGVTLPPKRSTAPVRVGGARLDDVADLGRIAAAVDEGATLVLQGLQRTSLPLARFCRALERATSHPVQANAYLTPAGASGLARHADDHDVLVLQVVGNKAWKVDDLGAVQTVAGTVLYIPAGTPHAAEAQRTASLHLTIGLLRVTHAQVLRRALDAVAGLLDLGRPLPLGYARPERAHELADDLQRTLTDVAGALRGPAAAVDPSALAGAEQERARTRRQPLALGQLRSILELGDLDGSTVVGRRLDHPARIAPEPAADGRVVLELLDRRLLLPLAMRPALEQLLREPELAVGALVGLDKGSQVVLARRLIREGLLVMAGRSPQAPASAC